MLGYGGRIVGDNHEDLTNFLGMRLKKMIDRDPNPGDGAAKKTEERQGLS
jgi:hypothetical protein